MAEIVQVIRYESSWNDDCNLYVTKYASGRSCSYSQYRLPRTVAEFAKTRKPMMYYDKGHTSQYTGWYMVYE